MTDVTVVQKFQSLENVFGYPMVGVDVKRRYVVLELRTVLEQH